jgi:hypothetical protein
MEGREISAVILHLRDHASLIMCDSSGDGKKWKFE